MNDTSDLYNDRKSGPKTFLTLMNPKPQTFNPAAQNLYVRSPSVRAGVCASEVEAKQTLSGVYIYIDQGPTLVTRLADFVVPLGVLLDYDLARPTKHNAQTAAISYGCSSKQGSLIQYKAPVCQRAIRALQVNLSLEPRLETRVLQYCIHCIAWYKRYL